MKTICFILSFVLLTTGMAFSAQTAPEYFALGTQLYGAKDYQGGYYAYEAGLKLDPNNGAGYQGLGDCLYQLGRQSEALGAFQQSLVLNPNNPQLATFVKSFKPLDTIAVETNKTKVVYTDEQIGISTPTPTAQGVTTVTHAEAKYGLFKDGWIRGYAGYDYALMGNFISGIQNWSPFLAANNANNLEPTNIPTNSVGNSGIRAGVEIGVNLDKSNTLSLSFDNVFTQNESYSNGASAMDPTLQSATFQPNLTSVSLNYTVDFITSKDAKTYFTFGAGYYHATVNVSAVDPTPDSGLAQGPVSFNGTFTGDVLGGTLGLGQIISIGDSFGIELSAHVRFATFGQMTASSLTINGTSTPAPSGGFILVTDGYDNGAIDVDAFDNLGNTNVNEGVAVLDYSGFYSDLSLNFYF